MNPHHRAHYELERSGGLPMWVVYFNTKEYPGKYIARLWRTLPENIPTEYVMTHDHLEGVREMIPQTCVCLTRNPLDEASIVETWL